MPGVKVFLSAAIALLLLAAVGALAFIYSGALNIAASEPHTALGRWVLDTTMKHSVKRRAGDVTAPPPAERTFRAEAGFRAYDEMCVLCHGAPGLDATALARGLTPPAPDLAKAAEHWSPEELFWIVKHGIKMTGMPAWGASHSDEEIWDIVAFVERLPSMSPQQYRSLQQSPPDAAGGGRHGH